MPQQQQQQQNQKMNGTRSFGSPNWKPLERWLSPDRRKDFAWMWRQGRYHYYRHSLTGGYLVLDDLGQCHQENNSGELTLADFGQRYKQVTGKAYQSPPSHRIEVPATNTSTGFFDPGDSLPADLADSLPDIVRDVTEGRVGQIWRPEDQQRLQQEMHIFAALLIQELKITCKDTLQKAMQWLG